MRGAIVITIAILIVSSAAAAPPQAAHKGLQRACQQSSSAQPCTLLGDVTVGPGETTTYRDGTYVASTITVETGGTLVIENATVGFTAKGEGILVAPGGTLHVLRSTLEPREAGSSYRVDLAPGSDLVLNLSTVRGGTGVKLATSSADVAGNSFEQIPLALFLDHVVVTIHHNQFLNNTVAVNQTGGVTTLDSNLFQGGDTCVRDWLADPTISNNVFRGCHTGIFHERSASVFYNNDMEDEFIPPGSGIVVKDTNSPVIEGNSIRNYGVGVLVINATAYVRNNTIANNVDDGVRVEQNTQPMDITGNAIHDNGGDGIHLVGAQDVALQGNTVTDNGAYGVRVDGGSGITIDATVADRNGIDGIAAVLSPGIALSDNTARENGATGIVLGTGTFGAVASDSIVSGNGQHGIFVRSNGSAVHDALVAGNGLSGLRVDGAADVDLASITATGNGEHGIFLVNAALDAAGLEASGNALDGIAVAGVANAVLLGANASGNGRDGFRVVAAPGSSVDLTGAIAIGNVGTGLLSSVPTAANNGWWEGNGGAGIENTDPDHVLPAECGYWGSSSGPTNADNPGGTGDEAVGNVDFTPFHTSPALTSCTPVAAIG